MRVLLIGLDGMTWKLVGPWIEAGELPHLQKLMQRGAWGTLRSTLPPVSSSSWSSFLTGMNPGKHGLVDFVYPDIHSYQVKMASATSRRTRALWNWLNEAGCRVGLLGVPTTYPPQPIDGFMISGFLTPSSDHEWAYPPQLKGELLKELGQFLLRPNERYRSTRRLDRFLDDLTASVENRTQAALYLMRRQAWDLFAVVYWDTDMVQHETWRLLDPSHPRYDPIEAAAHRERILAFHRKVDADVGRLLEEAGEDVLVIVMSDHGFGPVHSFFLTNTWLASLGLLRFRRGLWTAVKRFLFQLGFTPLGMFHVARMLGLGKLRRQVRFQQQAGLLNRLFLSFADVDWTRTSAFSVGSFGQVYINVAGTWPHGTVQPGAPYEELRGRIVQEALALRDPRTDEPVMERVYRREEAASGPSMHQLPDLILQPRNWEYMAFGHTDFGANKLVQPITGLSGHHRPDGLLMIAGPAVRAGTHLEGASILDLAPTILHVMGLGVPQEMDGRVLREAFDPASPAGRPVTYSSASVYHDGSSAGDLGGSEMASVQERLRGWGYAG